MAHNLTYSSGGSYIITDTAQTNALQKLCADFLEAAGYPGTALTSVTLTFSNIPFAVYNVYVYVSVNNAAGQATITDGNTTFYALGTNAVSATATQITSNSTNYQAGNYVLFTGETSSTLTITGTNVSNYGTGFSGFQIVQVSSSANYNNNFVINGNATLDVTGSCNARLSAR